MPKRNIIVVGASAGGFEALKVLVAGFPADLDAAVLIVWHMAAQVPGILPQVLDRVGSVNAKQAEDGEHVNFNQIYVAPPDQHLIIENDIIRTTRGPKENRFRPAVDPLFRSAAYSYGPRVIGVVLSGALDDGTAGLWTIKRYGGLAVVQHPDDAEVPSMPESAMKEIDVDHAVPIAEMADLLVRTSSQEVTVAEVAMKKDEKTEFEVKTAAEDHAQEGGIMNFGSVTPYTCPDCHGVLFELTDGPSIRRFRCHTGHAFSADSLLSALTENIEDSVWTAIRAIEESVLLLNQMGTYLADNNHTERSALYFRKAFEAEDRIEKLRQVVFSHEHLNNEILTRRSDGNGGRITKKDDQIGLETKRGTL